MTPLNTLPVGAWFTFPDGTEDAGVRFVVLENYKVRCLVRAEVGLTLNPCYRFDGSEMVVPLAA